MIKVIFHNLEARFGISLVLRSNFKRNNAPLRKELKFYSKYKMWLYF